MPFTQALPDCEFVAAFGAGTIWNVDGRAVYIRADRDMRYPTWEGQLYLTAEGVYVVENARWVKQETAA